VLGVGCQVSDPSVGGKGREKVGRWPENHLSPGSKQALSSAFFTIARRTGCDELKFSSNYVDDNKGA
jgi:hypothetical protein